MTSRVIQTTIEPSIVTVPVFRTDVFSASSRAVSTFTSLATKTITTVTATSTVAADSPASLSKSTGIPPLPSAFDSPLATGKDPTPAIAIVTLIAVILCALILLLALGYFIFLRFRGKCPNCPRYEDELKKWKTGDLKPIVPEMVRERMRAWDEEMGAMDLQAQMYRDRMQQQQSLACLDGQTQDNQTKDDRTMSGQTLKGRTDSGWSSEATGDEKEKANDSDKEKEQVKQLSQTGVDLQEPVPAHVVVAVARLGPDDEAILVNPALRNPNFEKSYSTYIRNVYAPREEERKRDLQDAADKHRIEHLLKVASNPNNQESVQERAMEEYNQFVVGRDVKEAEMKENMIAP